MRSDEEWNEARMGKRSAEGVNECARLETYKEVEKRKCRAQNEKERVNRYAGAYLWKYNRCCSTQPVETKKRKSSVTLRM